MGEQSKPVLTYEPPQHDQSRWLWFAVGLVGGIVLTTVVAVPFINRLREGANRIKVSSNVGKTQLALKFYTAAPAPAPVIFPQGDGELHLTRHSIGVPYGKFVFLSQGTDVVPLRITCPTEAGRIVEYEWIRSPDGGLSFAESSVERGSGTMVEKGGSERFTAGPFKLAWSRGNDKGGWVYWPGYKHFAVAKSMADSIDEFEKTVASATWADEEGTTVDPRRARTSTR